MPAAALLVNGDVKQPLTLAPSELKSMPRTTVTVIKDGRSIVYEGVLIGELLKGPVRRVNVAYAAALT